MNTLPTFTTFTAQYKGYEISHTKGEVIQYATVSKDGAICAGLCTQIPMQSVLERAQSYIDIVLINKAETAEQFKQRTLLEAIKQL